MMMIDALEPAAALAPAAAPMEDAAPPSEPIGWRAIAEDARFFLICYLAGLLVFLVMLS